MSAPESHYGNSSTSYIGQLFSNRYLIQSEIARGGFGIVYLAQDQQLHTKLVAIKVLLEHPVDSAWYEKKFKQEIEALARLEHPGIVSIFGSGHTPDGKPFLTMQYVKGKPLNVMIKPEGLSFDFVVKTMRQLGQALSAAHDANILHCDMKPQNIIMQDLGGDEYQAKIVDFGIAKIRNSQVRSAETTRLVGSESYMSPEHTDGRPQAESDVFSLAVIACELLAGRRPFTVYSRDSVLEALQNGGRLEVLNSRFGLPPEAHRIIAKALSNDPAMRYARARDFGELLAQALSTDSSSTTANEGEDLEMAHTLFMDVVGYSKLPSDEQTIVVKQLQEAVTNSETFQQAQRNRQNLTYKSTGDGMLLAFFNKPTAPVQCAIEISRELRAKSRFGLRMGVNSGTVYRSKDMNQIPDVAGAGVNIAYRVMDCGDAGHILLSKSSADLLLEAHEWRGRIHPLGVQKVKHDVPVHLYNLYFDDVGNRKSPQKFHHRKNYKVIAAVFALLLVVGVTAFVVFNSASKRADTADNPSMASGEKELRDLLRTVYADGIKTKEEQTEIEQSVKKYSIDATRLAQQEQEMKDRLSRAQMSLKQGMMYASQNNYKEAIKEFAHSVQIDPDSSFAWANLAAGYLSLNDLQQAQIACEKSLAIDTQNWLAHYNLGSLYAKRGEVDNAIEELSKAVQFVEENSTPKMTKSALVNYIKSDQTLIPLHTNSKFQQLIVRP